MNRRFPCSLRLVVGADFETTTQSEVKMKTAKLILVDECSNAQLPTRIKT